MSGCNLPSNAKEAQLADRTALIQCTASRSNTFSKLQLRNRFNTRYYPGSLLLCNPLIMRIVLITILGFLITWNVQARVPTLKRLVSSFRCVDYFELLLCYPRLIRSTDW